MAPSKSNAALYTMRRIVISRSRNLFFGYAQVLNILHHVFF